MHRKFRVGQSEKDSGPSRIIWMMLGGITAAVGFKIVEHYLPSKTQTVYITQVPPAASE